MDKGQAHKTVLVVDDCLDVLEVVALILDDAGFNVVCTAEPRRAMTLCEEVGFDVALCDLYIDDADGKHTTSIGGMDLIWRLRDRFPSMPVIAMSGVLREENLTNLKRNGIYGILSKPFDRQVLLQEVSSAIQAAAAA